MNSLEPNNRIYQILSQENRNIGALNKLNSLLCSNKGTIFPELDGRLLHYLTETTHSSDDFSWRMVYSLSNAGIDVNVQDIRGNTALHLAYMRGYTEIGFNFIEALLKVGIDLNLKNNSNKTASYYMEDIEQLNSMYKAHFPGIWTAVQESNVDDVQRLINALVKCNPRKGNVDLIEYSTKLNNGNSVTICNILSGRLLQNEYAHSVIAIDMQRMDSMSTIISDDKFEPNLADYSYCFSWYKPVCRNLPKFLFEIALETKNEDLIRVMLSKNCNVNLLNSNSGNPFYFNAFQPEYSRLKSELLKNANFSVKNNNGQSLLFYIVYMYLKCKSETNDENVNNLFEAGLIDDFVQILKQCPLLLTDRDQENLSLVEWIIQMGPLTFKRAEIFLKQISNTMLELLQDKNFKVFQEMIYHSYGLVLLNSPIYNEPENLKLVEQQTITFEQFILENNLNEMKIYLKKFQDMNFFKLANDFVKAIKVGDLVSIRNFLLIEKNHFLVKLKDISGRSCLHLAVLYGQKPVIKFFLQHYSSLVKVFDNLNRSALHYAYALDDQKIVDILNLYITDKKTRDFKFFMAEDYLLDEVKNDESFGVKNFRENQFNIHKSNVSFLKCFIYKQIKTSIENHDIDQLKTINLKLKLYELSLRDLPIKSLKSFFIAGESYISPLELAMKTRNFLAFSYLIDTLYSSIVLNKTRRIRIVENSFIESDKHEMAFVNEFEIYLNDLREKAEEEEIYEIVDILDNFEEDKEITAITEEKNTDFNKIYMDSLKNISKNLNKSNNNVISMEQFNKKWNNFEQINSITQNHNKQQEKIVINENVQKTNQVLEQSKYNSKLCSIL